MACSRLGKKWDDCFVEQDDAEEEESEAGGGQEAPSGRKKRRSLFSKLRPSHRSLTQVRALHPYSVHHNIIGKWWKCFTCACFPVLATCQQGFYVVCKGSKANGCSKWCSSRVCLQNQLYKCLLVEGSEVHLLGALCITIFTPNSSLSMLRFPVLMLH